MDRTIEQLQAEIDSNLKFIKLVYLRTMRLYEQVVAKQAKRLSDHESKSA